MNPINPAVCMTAEDTAIIFSGPPSRLTMLDGDQRDIEVMRLRTALPIDFIGRMRPAQREHWFNPEQFA